MRDAGVHQTDRDRRVLGFAAALVAVTPGFAAATASARTIQWHGCGPECRRAFNAASSRCRSTTRVRLGATTKLGFARLPARDRARRVGSLIINPGGPGAAGSSFVAVEALGRHLWHPALHRRFDLIGMDPRGTGTSAPIQCDPGACNQVASLFPRTAAEFEHLTAPDARAGRELPRGPGRCSATWTRSRCARLGGAATSARRREAELPRTVLRRRAGHALRRALSEAHPAMALDAILDHSIPTGRIFSTRRGLRGYVQPLCRLVRADKELPAARAERRRPFDRLVARPTASRSRSRGVRRRPARPPVSGAEIRLDSFNPLSTKLPVAAFGFPAGRPRAALVRPEPATPAPSPGHWRPARTRPFAGLAVICLDYPTLIALPRPRRRRCSLARSPRTPTAPARRGPPSPAASDWPVPPANPPHRARSTARRRSCSHSTHDPSTPYRGRTTAPRQIPGAVLLTRDGDGHTPRCSHRQPHQRRHRQLPHHPEDAPAEHRLREAERPDAQGPTKGGDFHVTAGRATRPSGSQRSGRSGSFSPLRSPVNAAAPRSSGIQKRITR